MLARVVVPLAAPNRQAFEMISAGPTSGSGSGSTWSVGTNMSCSECQRVVRNLEGYCNKQRPMGDLDLRCFDCTWAHHEMPGCQRIMSLINARPQPLAEQTSDCCLTKCSCIPSCDDCLCDDCPSPPPPAPETEPPCVCLDPEAAQSALHGIRKYCSSFRPADRAVWVADASEEPFGGHYQIPTSFASFCSLHAGFSVEGQPDAACQSFLQRLTVSSRPEPAKICELACADWCDPCCPEPAADTPPLFCHR